MGFELPTSTGVSFAGILVAINSMTDWFVQVLVPCEEDLLRLFELWSHNMSYLDFTKQVWKQRPIGPLQRIMKRFQNLSFCRVFVGSPNSRPPVLRSHESEGNQISCQRIWENIIQRKKHHFLSVHLIL